MEHPSKLSQPFPLLKNTHKLSVSYSSFRRFRIRTGTITGFARLVFDQALEGIQLVAEKDMNFKVADMVANSEIREAEEGLLVRSEARSKE